METGKKSNEELELHLVQLEEENLELRRAQLEAEVLKEKYHTLYHNAPAGYLTIDQAGKIVEGNRVAAALLGHEKRWLINFPLISFLAAESKMKFAGFLKAVGSSVLQQRCEVRLKEDAGSEWALLEGVLALDGAKERATYLIALVDITQRKRAEEKIVALNEALSEQAAELKEANKELEAFNYTVAHDLRQPLNLVSMNCQAIKFLGGSRLDATADAYLNSAQRGVERMSELIETLLRFSLVGKAELKREQVELSEMADVIAAGLQAMAPERNVVFEITGGIWAHGDTDLVRVVLENLFGNAWKFTASRPKAVIAFGMSEVAGEAVYYVRDNGTGFDPAELGGIFAPFARLSAAKRYKGFGIGLATVERIIVRHGGKIWAEGDPGKGATFYFTLSSQSQPAACGPLSPPSSGLSSANR